MVGGRAEFRPAYKGFISFGGSIFFEGVGPEWDFEGWIVFGMGLGVSWMGL